MTKKELITELHSRNPHLTKAYIEKVIEDVARIAANELIKEDEFTLPYIGKLSVDEVAARKGRNPQTGEAIDIPAKKRVKFKATKELADHVNL
jgi:nucleoid DNA-binding protein